MLLFSPPRRRGSIKVEWLGRKICRNVKYVILGILYYIGHDLNPGHGSQRPVLPLLLPPGRLVDTWMPGKTEEGELWYLVCFNWPCLGERDRIPKT